MGDQERQWIRKIQRGDTEAFKKLFYTYHARLCSLATNYVASRADARDVVQDVFSKLWERRAEWKIRRSLKAYLYRAVRNRALNQARNENTRREAQSSAASVFPERERCTAEDEIHFEALSAAIDEAIIELPERRREAFVLHRHHDFTYAEVAEIMDVSPKTVENQIGRALKDLRRQLSSYFLPEEIGH